jgi:dTDP-4-dehydrorhamnose reductase
MEKSRGSFGEGRVRRLWVTGAGGFVGTACFAYVRENRPELPILLISRRPWAGTDKQARKKPRHPGDFGHVAILGRQGGPIERGNAAEPVLVNALVDLTQPANVTALASEFPPAGILHLAAAADPNWCQDHPRESFDINVTAAEHLGEIAVRAGCRLVFASTDLVFDGTTGSYDETAEPHPLSLYATQKVEAEKRLRAACGELLTICRLPLMFGAPGVLGRNPQGPLLSALQAGTPVPLFDDEFRTPASTISIAAGLLAAWEQPRPILHLGGAERVSRYEFGIRLAHWLGATNARILRRRQKDLAMAAPRPADVSLNSALAFSLGYRPLPLEAEFERITYFGDFRDTIRKNDSAEKTDYSKDE